MDKSDEILKIVKKLERTVDEIKKTMDEVKREVGSREGRILSDQINEIERQSKIKDEDQAKILRETIAIKRLVEFNDINVGEIMKALSLIYRSVDELEEGVLPERQT